MNQPVLTVPGERAAEDLARDLFRERYEALRSRTDRMLACVMAFQWIAAMLVTFLLLPVAWFDDTDRIHPLFWDAVFYGAIVTIPATVLAILRPGRTSTRYVVAFSQMGWSALLIGLMNGRIEAHFHVFVTLAFLALYRDNRLLIASALFKLVDQLIRGQIHPISLFGSPEPTIWRPIEHGAWVAFEVILLAVATRRSDREAYDSCLQYARLSQSHGEVEAEVDARTQELRSYAGNLESMRQVLQSQAEMLSDEARRRLAAQERAEQANVAKSMFLANMSHEIRTPLTAVVGYADVLAERLTQPDNMEAVTAIKRNGEHLLRVIDDVLDLSKIEAGKLEIECLPTDLLPIFSDVLSVMHARAQSKSLRLKIEFQGRIPERIESDPTRLRQILLNIIGNAVKFTETGIIRIVVCIDKPESSRPLLRVEVHDRGIGMTSEQLNRIFAPFSQADNSTSRKFGGTGLGLVISRQLARRLGGDIVVTSQEGEGSTFTITLETGSLAHVEWCQNPQLGLSVQSRGPKPTQLRVTGDCRVLLAEDGPDNRKLISLFLRKGGVSVDWAENGRIAVEKIFAAIDSGVPYDVILMDMQMPEMDGYEASRVLRSRGYRGPIVALTAHAMKGDRETCLEAGCDFYLPKPVDRTQLLLLVAKCAGVGAVPLGTAQPQSSEVLSR